MREQLRRATSERSKREKRKGRDGTYERKERGGESKRVAASESLSRERKGREKQLAYFMLGTGSYSENLITFVVAG